MTMPPAIINVGFIFFITTVSTGARHSDVLNKILHEGNYDHEQRPSAEIGPVNISASLFITSIHTLSEISMDYGATLFLSLRWDDPRLSFIGIEPIDLRSGSNLLDKIWTPDLYFTNVKEAKIHEVTVTNKHVRIHPDGHVLYDMRVSLVLICHLYLQRFPMDKQTCGIELESFGYTTRDIQLDWDANFSAIIAPEVVMPEFTVGLPVTSKGMRRYPLGYYAQLQCQFSLHRELIFYVMEHYVPSFLLVILSWVSFWLSVDATPARASLGITTVLTLTTLSSTARTSLAKVSYTKAIDIWMLVCSLFVFAALLEFAVASYLHKATDTCDAHKARRRQSLNVDRRTPPHEHELLELTSKSGLQHRNHETRIYMEDSFYDEPPSLRNKGYKLISRRIDRYSRTIFPVTFAAFNFVYWPYYLHNYYG